MTQESDVIHEVKWYEITTLATWAGEEFRSMILFYGFSQLPSTSSWRKCTVMTSWERSKSENGAENLKIDERTRIYDVDSNCGPSTSRTDVSAARVEELILANRRVTVRVILWIAVFGGKCKQERDIYREVTFKFVQKWNRCLTVLRDCWK
jgi:hypothetical protein